MSRVLAIAVLVPALATSLVVFGDTPKDTPKDAPAEGSGSATPAEGSGAGSGSAASTGPDVDSLRQEYLSLRDELFKSRARANAVASQLYSTRVTMKLTWTSARYYGVSKASIRLDGASVYEDDKGAVASDDGVRYDGYIAPGRHVVTYRIEAAGKDDSSFTTVSEQTVVIKAVQGKDLLVGAKAKDSGDMSFQWKKGEHGDYQLGLDIAVKAVPRGTADKGRGK